MSVSNAPTSAPGEVQEAYARQPRDKTCPYLHWPTTLPNITDVPAAERSHGCPIIVISYQPNLSRDTRLGLE